MVNRMAPLYFMIGGVLGAAALFVGLIAFLRWREGHKRVS